MALSLSCWIQSEIVELWLSRSCDVCVPRCRWEMRDSRRFERKMEGHRWYDFFYLSDWKMLTSAQLHSSSSKEKFHFQHDWRSRVEKMKKKSRIKISDSDLRRRYSVLDSCSSLSVCLVWSTTQIEMTQRLHENGARILIAQFLRLFNSTPMLSLCLVCTKHRISFTIDFRPLHSPSQALPYRLIWMHTNILCAENCTQKKSIVIIANI